jgi:type IV secretion system protein VirB10
MGWLDRLKWPRRNGAEPAEGKNADAAAADRVALASLAAESENMGVPSVNRRRGNEKLINMMGIFLIVVGGLFVLYFSSGGSSSSGGAKDDKPAPRIQLQQPPPLQLPEMSKPPLPSEPIPQGKLAGNAAQPIPLAAARPASPAAATPAPQPLDWSDRKMGGSLLLSTSMGGDHKTEAGGQSTRGEGLLSLGGDRDKGARREGPALAALSAEGEDGRSELGGKLKPTVTKPVSAEMLPNRNFLLTKGTMLNCALETAIDSSLPGLTTCRLTRDIYSDNGHVVLLDRGSQLVGEYQGAIQNGQVRIFVLWTRAKTPNGVVVALNSPGTDSVGRSGVPGALDTHFFERFGAAILMSMVKDLFAYARAQVAANGTSSNGTVVVGGGGGGGGGNPDQMSTEILRNTVNIPPTLYVNQGEHIQVMVARDLDFSRVYGLELKK